MTRYRQIKIKPSGFTLIEMIIAVSIFAVVASIVFPALIEFLEVRERLDEKHEQVVSLQKAFLFLAKDLRYASNRLGKDEFGDEGKTTLAVGDEGLIELTAMYPDLNLDGVNVPRRVRWVLEKGVLERLQYPVMDPDSDTRLLRQKLIKDVEEVEIEVSSVEDGRDNTSKKWEEQTRLPDLISVTVTLDSGVEYRRVFTMLGGDSIDAIAAAGAPIGTPGGNSSGRNPNEDSDEIPPPDDGL